MKETAEGQLFTSAGYLGPLAGCATPEMGWQRENDFSEAVYLKQHSWGEFVFDQAFANAYHQQGLSYYPKLVCAIPFTPVPGPRLGEQCAARAAELQAHARSCGASSVHLLFVPQTERRALQDSSFVPRIDLRYVWRDRGYGDMSGFLAALRRKKRKNIVAERRRVAATGLRIEWRGADEIADSEWTRLYQLYASTYRMRGQLPYLSLDCLRAWGRAFGTQLQFCLALSPAGIEAMAYFFREGSSLYGRHWGAARDYHALHFELCYYQAIEYCLAQGLRHFDAGVQGAHRLQRGFEPEISTSLHWFAEPRFHEAVASYLGDERRLVRQQLEAARAATAFAERRSC